MTIINDVLKDPSVHAAIAELIVAALGAVLTAVATLAGMLIKTKLHAADSSWKQKLAYRFVCYAENKVIGDKEKQEYVADQLHTMFPSISVDEVEHLIEEAVVQLTSVQSSPIINVAANATSSPAAVEPPKGA